MSENTTNETENVGHIVTADELVMDEATIIREQERLAEEKKKKKARKTRTIVFSVLGVLVLAGVWFLIWGKNLLNKEEDTAIKIVTTAAQEVTFVKVDSIKGNEITYTVLEEDAVVENADASSEDAGSESISGNASADAGDASRMPNFGGSNGGQRPDRNSFENANSDSTGGSAGGSTGGTDGSPQTQGGGFGGFGGGQMPEGFDASQLPEGFDASQMPSFDGSNSSQFSNFGSSGSGTGNMTGGGRGQSSASATTLSYDGKTYHTTAEDATVLIPVGTVVTTKLGTETTFSRIAAGDCLGLVMENIDGEETIMAIYIVG